MFQKHNISLCVLFIIIIDKKKNTILLTHYNIIFFVKKMANSKIIMVNIQERV